MFSHGNMYYVWMGFALKRAKCKAWVKNNLKKKAAGFELPGITQIQYNKEFISSVKISYCLIPNNIYMSGIK